MRVARSPQGQGLPAPEACLYLTQLAQGLRHLQRHGIAHGYVGQRDDRARHGLEGVTGWDIPSRVVTVDPLFQSTRLASLEVRAMTLSSRLVSPSACLGCGGAVTSAPRT